MNTSTILEYQALIDYFFSCFKVFLQDLPAVQYLFFNKILTIIIAIIGIAAFYFKASSELKKYRRIAREKNALNFEYQMSQDEEYQSYVKSMLTIISPALRHGRQIKLPNGAIYTNVNKALCYFYCKIILKDKSNISSASTILNRWEMCANGIRSGLLDEDYLYKIHATTVIIIYDLFFIFIKTRQLSSPRAFITFEWLAKKWKVERLRTYEMEVDNEKITKEISSFDELMKIKSKFRLWCVMKKIKFFAK